MQKQILYHDYLLKIINSASEGIYVTDTERRFLIWNDAAEKISGYKREEVIGRACTDNILCHTDENNKELCLDDCPLVATMQAKAPCGPTVVYLKHKDGRNIPVEVSAAPVLDDGGNVIGGVELFQDVTDRLEKERVILEKKLELEAVLNNIREGILFIDGHGKISLWNRALTEMLSLFHEDMKGANIATLSEGHRLGKALSRAQEGFKGPFCWQLNDCPRERGDCPGHGQGQCRCWMVSAYRDTAPMSSRCADCLPHMHARRFLEKPKQVELGQRTVSVLSSFIESKDKNEIGEVVLFRDVTPEKLDAVMKLAGGAAHELRQPLQVLLNTAFLLEGELSATNNMAGYLDAIRQSCFRLNDIVRKIGDITQYRLKPYAENKNIIDIDKSSEEVEIPLETNSDLVM